MAGSRKNDAPGNIRSGMFVVGNRGNVLSDEQRQPSNLPESVCLLVVRPDGKILAVSSTDNVHDLNMPGGLIGPGETPEEAARRELLEETGLEAGKIIEIYSGQSRSKECATFRVLNYTGELRSSHEGIAKWSDPEELLYGTFGSYFKKLAKQIGIM